MVLFLLRTSPELRTIPQPIRWKTESTLGLVTGVFVVTVASITCDQAFFSFGLLLSRLPLFLRKTNAWSRVTVYSHFWTFTVPFQRPFYSSVLACVTQSNALWSPEKREEFLFRPYTLTHTRRVDYHVTCYAANDDDPSLRFFYQW